MSLSIHPKNGVKLRTSRKRGWGIATLIIALEGVFSFFLYLSLAQHVFVATPAAATSGVPSLISYQGLLTDTSGNPLGGTGSVYCFRYSIWDSQSGGSELWPQPPIDASTTPGNSTTTVVNGVFSDELFRVDTSSLDFYSTSSYYLQVQVSTSSPSCASGIETLSPRQRITSDAWSETSQSVYGNLLRTEGVSTGTVQIGTGGGATYGNQTLLSLDTANNGTVIGGSCTGENGALWYDSTLKRAVVCENNTILPISNNSTTIGGVAADTSTPISSGNVIFQDGNNFTFGQNGSTITASADLANLPTFYTYQNRQLGASLMTQPGQNVVWLSPFQVSGGNVSASTLALIESFSGTVSTAGSGSWAQTIQWAIYSQNPTNSTEMDTWQAGNITMSMMRQSSNQFTFDYEGIHSTSSRVALLSNITGLRIINDNVGATMTPGLYMWGFAVSTADDGVDTNFISSSGMVFDNPASTLLGTIGGNTVLNYENGGTWSVGTSGAMPNSIALTDISPVSNQVPYFKVGEL